MNFSITETKWMKLGKCHDFVFVGMNIVATASGIHVSFLDLNTREKRIERFDDRERGDGASCLAGHPAVPMFSVAERKCNPKISIFMYPTLRKISTCAFPDRINGYLSCCFAGTEYLVSLTGFPNFRLIAWLWKTGKHIAVLDTKINNPVQEIHCSPNSPYLISQHGLADGILAIYQIRTCSKIVNVHHVDVSLPKYKVASSSWTPEGNLFAADERGNVWLAAIDANKLYWVVKSKAHEPWKSKPIVIAHQGGVMLVKNDRKITFYKKSSLDWNVSWQFIWSISVPFQPVGAKKQHAFKDGILFHSENGEIFQISIQGDDIPRIEIIHSDEIEYKALFSISQCADHVAAVDRLDRLCFFELSTGKLTARLSLRHHGEVLCIDSHPVAPVIAWCSALGSCIFINVTNVSAPETFNCFHLHKDPLDIMKFSRYGEFLAIGNSRNGRIFIIGKRFEEKQANVLGLVEADRRIMDFLIYARNKDHLEVLVFATTSLPSIGSSKVIVYACEISKNFSVHAVCTINLSRSFRRLYYGSDNPLCILGVPSLSKQLYQMEIQNDFQDIVLTKVLSSMHQIRNVGICMTEFYVLTYGYDGLIIIRDSSEIRRVIAIFMLHHRNERGIKCATSSHFGEILVSLGRNGDLVASHIRLPEMKGKEIVKLKTTTSSLSIQDFFVGPNELYDRQETWLDNVNAAKLKIEHGEIAPLRASIIADLKRIKDRIHELLDINESKRSEARLPISSFDLDDKFRRRKMEEAQLEREKIRRSVEEACAERDQVASYLREIFWQPLQVKPCILKSIGDDVTVQNYPLVASVRKIADYKRWDRLSSDAEEFLYSFDVHGESISKEDDERPKTIAISSDKEPSMINDDKVKIHETIETWYKSADEVEKSCISGITAHRWIKDEGTAFTHQLLSPYNIDFETILKNDVIVENREHKLKMHFNNLFEEMRSAKECQLKCAEKRIDRLRYCAFELKTMFGIDSFLEPIEMPTWNIGEMPEYVVTVEDREVFEKRWKQEESNTKIVRECFRNMKGEGSNSDFYIKTLDKMMDGVLELKWEDEVKKEIPVPECMTTKDSSRYTETDIAIIACYKSKVQALQVEREKYKAMLLAEMTQTKEALQRDTTNFNDKLKGLELKRMQIECAILQERSMRIRAIRRYRARVDCKQKIVRLTDEELVPAMQQARGILEECNSLEVVVSELKARYDNLCKAEKRQETKFRGEFANLKQPIVEHLLRHYKKQPRAGRLTCTSVTYLTEVARCVVLNDKSEILPRECLDFLRAMEALDSMPGNLPPQINVNHWRTMCKLRRAKVETETKVRCCAVETAEAEQTLWFYQKAMQSADNVVACKRASLENAQGYLKRFTEEMEVQVVLRLGQIEISLEGSPFDYQQAVLVTRQELLRVNDSIVEMGKRKLAAMHKSMHLRKILSQHEWQHACERMMLDDLQRELNDIAKFKITKNVLNFLNCRAYNVHLKKDYEKMQDNLRVFQNKFRDLLEMEQACLSKTKRLILKRRKRNHKISRRIKSESSDIAVRRALFNDPCYRRDEESRKIRLVTIAKRTRLIMKVEDNYEQLLTLHARLEVLKLRTYPTLKFKPA